MEFKQKYPIKTQLLTAKTKRRPGIPMKPGVKFIVAHDTGNPNSTAAGNTAYYEKTCNIEEAAAHFFVDDKEIIECIPVLCSAQPEKAWHVHYNSPVDNKLFSLNANDAAVGIEYCHGKKINADEAYDRYVWLMAYLCHKFNLDPTKSVVGHFILDSGRRTDPKSGLEASGRTYEQLLLDVAIMYNNCLDKTPETSNEPKYNFVEKSGSAKTTMGLFIRVGAPTREAPKLSETSIPAGTILKYIGCVNNGEMVNGIATWYKDTDGNYFWSGGVSLI